MEKTDYIYFGEGLLRAFVLTLILLLLSAVVRTFASLPDGIVNMTILVSTMLGVMYGTIYATRKIRRKGWIIGLCLGLTYIVILYIVSMIAGRESAVTIRDFTRIILAIVTGTLSGMLGINL